MSLTGEEEREISNNRQRRISKIYIFTGRGGKGGKASLSHLYYLSQLGGKKEKKGKGPHLSYFVSLYYLLGKKKKGERL